MYYEVSVPVRKYLIKMIAKHKPVDPLELTIGKDHYSGIFFNAFTAQNYKRDYNVGLKIDDSFAPLKILFNQKLTSTNRFFLDGNRLKWIDQQLRDAFNEKLFATLDCVTEFNTVSNGIKVNVTRFMELYDIEESDITHAALVKKYQRYRNSLVQDKKKIDLKRLNSKNTITSNLTFSC